MQPTIENEQIPFRGPTSSERFNKFISDAYYDIVRLFQRASKHDLDIKRNMDLLTVENHFLLNKINQLETDLINLSDLLNQKRKMTKTFHSNEDIINGDPGATINTHYGIATQSMAQEVSKTYLLDSAGNSVIPEELKVTVYESTTPFTNITNISDTYRVDDEEVYNAFHKDNELVWQRKSIHDQTVDAVYSVIKIKLPQNIINHLRVNTIYLDPSPQFAQSVMDIQYTNLNGWYRLDTYPTETIGNLEVPIEIPNSSRQVFLFDQTDMTELVIYIKQPNWLDEDGSRIFIYGFRSLGVFFTRFAENDSKFRVKFTVPNDDLFFTSITGVSILDSLGGISTKMGEFEELVDAHIYTEGGEKPVAIGDPLPVGTQSIYVEVTLRANKFTNVAPLIGGVEIEYSIG